VGRWGSWVSMGGTKGEKQMTIGRGAKNNSNSTFFTLGGSITNMNTSSSQMDWCSHGGWVTPTLVAYSYKQKHISSQHIGNRYIEVRIGR